ncbi:hypothetical protein C8J56DRAFT_1056099 [Mycena floridula]|nr:hypothetical protein C8J56DRAFT_1056099 [Mycena floridula]
MFNKSFVLTAVLITAVRAVDICAFTTTTSCSGASSCCTNLNPSQCCRISSPAFGESVAWSKLPSFFVNLQAWSGSNCGDGPIDTNSNVNLCWTSQGSTKATFVAFGVPTLEGGEAVVDDALGCATPNILNFVADGQNKTIVIPEGSYETVLALYADNDFAALDAFESIEYTRE